LFDHYGDSDVEDQEQPLIFEDQRFTIFNHESKRSQERRCSSKRNMPYLFGHKEQVEYCLAEHQLDEHNWSNKLLQKLSPKINKSTFPIIVLEFATNIEQHVISNDISLQQFLVL